MADQDAPNSPATPSPPAPLSNSGEGGAQSWGCSAQPFAIPAVRAAQPGLSVPPSPELGRGVGGEGAAGESGASSQGQGRSRLFNRVRRISSIPLHLLRTGKPYLIPLYYLLRLSDAAREAMDYSGSYRFADHIYAGRASGVGPLGRLIDVVLLRLPSARSFRNRYRLSVAWAVAEVRTRLAERERVDVLSVPAGVGRDLVQLARLLGPDARRVGLHALDLDPAPLQLGQALARASGVAPPTVHRGDLFEQAIYPDVDLALCSGITEFLADDQVVQLFRVIGTSLRPGGALITTSTLRHPLTAYLLENLGDLRTHYRDAGQLRALLGAAGYTVLRCRLDLTGYQAIALATPEAPDDNR